MGGTGPFICLGEAPEPFPWKTAFFGVAALWGISKLASHKDPPPWPEDDPRIHGLSGWSSLPSGARIGLVAGGGLLLFLVLKRPAVAAAKELQAVTRIDDVLPYLKGAAGAAGVPVSWLAAIARQETRFDVRGANISAADSALGGSWGLCQVSFETAKTYGFKGTVPDRTLVKNHRYTGAALTGLMDPATNAGIAARILAGVRKAGRGIADAAATYNSGRTLAKLATDIDIFDRRARGQVTGAKVGSTVVDSLTPEKAASRRDRLIVTRDEYVPHVVEYQRQYAHLDA